MSWDLGRYEQIAVSLLPAAQMLVARAGVHPGERVLDVGCGTGNVALIAAQQGAPVIGVDPAARLIEVARQLAAQRGLDAKFLVGEARELPVASSSVELVLSSFGIVFEPNARAAIRELARVLTRRGRALFSSWLPVGPLFELGQLRRMSLAAPANPAAPAPFAWHDSAALAALFEEAGMQVSTSEHALRFEAPSASAFLDAELATHPLWVGVRAELEAQGTWNALREHALELLQRANRSRHGFEVLSHYRLAVATR